MSLGVGSLGRTLALTIASGALTALALTALVSSGMHAPPAAGFGGLLEYAAWWSLLAAGAWASAILALVLRAHATGRLGRLPCPRAWRPVIAALCGLGAAGLIAMPAATAAGSAPPSGSSLPSLGRTHGGPAHEGPSQERPAHERPAHRARIVVRAGDCLWTIVARRHPGEPPATTARRVAQLHRANRELIGPDADLIRPGQRLIADDSDPATVHGADR